ncbi:phage tail protein [Sphingomonas sp. PB2P19]|uniref:phage tail protein n=1 Tax=Sphingomonas rhamnosi TaxID=3096156 RepID=UPI002FC5C981
MGKVLKIVAVIAVAAAIAYFAPTIAAAFLASTATAATTAAVTAAVAATLAIAASAAMTLLAGRPSTSAATPGVFRQALSNSFIIYGKRRVGGLLIFFHPIGKDYRYFVVAVAGHRCRGVTRWYLGDEEVSVDGAGKVTTGTYANNAWLWFARGTEDQVANATFVAETQGKWTANHRGRGTALIYAKFKMVDAVVQAGMPNITAEVEGKDDILDYRTDTRGYTRNAALIFYDWMLLPREEGGFGAYQDEIDEDWVAAQANVCDEVCALPGGGTEARYELDCYITTGAAPSEVRDTLVTCCAGSFTYSGGKMLMHPGYYVPPSATLSERDLAGAINVPALLAGDQIATEMTGTYIDPDNLYQPRDVPTRFIDSDEVRQSSIDLPHITSGTRGQRILEIALRKSQAERRVIWPMNIVGIGIATLDTVQLATARYGLSNYSFQVVSWGLSQDFSVVLQLEETSPDIFEFTTDMYRTVGNTGVLVSADPIDGNADYAATAGSAASADTAAAADTSGAVSNGTITYTPAQIKALEDRIAALEP